MKRLSGGALLALLAAGVATLSEPIAAQARGVTDNVTIRVSGSSIANVTSSPLPISPAFGPGIVDYVWSCIEGTNHIQLAITAVPGGILRIGASSGSSVTIQQDLVENQALVISAPGPADASASKVGQQTDQSDPAAELGQVQYWIRCLPHDFPQLNVSRLGNPTPGWYLTSNLNSRSGSKPYAMVLDNNGTPVWYRRPAGATVVNVTPLPDGTIAWAGPPAFEDYNLKTQSTRLISPPDTSFDAHELHSLPNGDVMVLSYPAVPNVDLTALGLSSTATLTDCVIEQLDSKGQVVWRWSAKDHISIQESLHPSGGDIFHCNSADTDPVSGDVLLSVRHTDAVYLIDKATGVIIWKLGGNSQNHDNAQLLTIMGDPDGVFHAQHDARFRPNSDVSLFDDQSWNPSLPARGVEYHIDRTAGTATLVWAFQSPDGQNSQATGSFRRLNGGDDNIVGWGIRSNPIVFTEVDAQGRTLLSVTFPNGEWSYRAVKVPATALNHGFLRATAGLPPFVLTKSPTVAFVGPARGLATGGARVTITGKGFTGATAVNFGPNAAAEFTVNNDGSITAKAPGGSGVVTVTVTTPGGTTPPTAQNIATAVDSEFEGDIGSWRSAGGLALDALQAHSGAYSLRLSPSSDGIESVASARYAVPARALVDGSVWVLTPRQQDRVRAFAAFFDAKGALIEVAKGRSVTTAIGVWTVVAQMTTSPPGTVSATLGLEDISGTDAVYLDSASLMGTNQYAYQPAHGD